MRAYAEAARVQRVPPHRSRFLASFFLYWRMSPFQVVIPRSHTQISSATCPCARHTPPFAPVFTSLASWNTRPRQERDDGCSWLNEMTSVRYHEHATAYQKCKKQQTLLYKVYDVLAELIAAPHLQICFKGLKKKPHSAPGQ